METKKKGSLEFYFWPAKPPWEVEPGFFFPREIQANTIAEAREIGKKHGPGKVRACKVIAEFD